MKTAGVVACVLKGGYQYIHTNLLAEMMIFKNTLCTNAFLFCGWAQGAAVKRGRGSDVCGRVKDAKANVNRTRMSASQQRREKVSLSRRTILTGAAAQIVLSPVARAIAEVSSSGRSSEQAVQAFREVTALQDLAFEFTNQMRFSDAEVLWSKIISMNESNAAAYSNRGNCRTSQAKFKEALDDFERAIQLAPEEPDSFLGKGVALEGLRDYEGALRAYKRSYELSLQRFGEKDVVALNNIGNAYGGMGDWQSAYEYYQKAASAESKFVFALANQALASYELGDDKKALQTMRFLTRKYPGFGDMHAATAMVLWEQGDQGGAETEWYKAVQADVR